MSEVLIAQNQDYQRRKALESDLADLIERVKRLEAARPPPQDDPLLNQEQAAVVIGVKPPTLAMWRHKGKGPPYSKIGRSAFYRRSAVEAWLDAQAVIPTPKTEIGAA
jgi:predicted DNA-binding transcriptional regulator AlpA